MKITKSDIIITQLNHGIEISAMVDGQRFKTVYSGWSKAICVKMFMREVNNIK